MTVCVAAIAGNGVAIIGASDRMITGIAKYEAPERKVFTLTNSIIAMWSGDSSLQRLLMNKLKVEVDARVAAAPNTWLTIKEVAEMFQAHFNKALQDTITQRVLVPFGLDLPGFLSQQQQLDPGLNLRLINAIQQVTAPDIATLFCGMDLSGAHIYEFENIYSAGEIHCHDSTGFAAIGSGDWHARSQLMLAGYGPSQDVRGALFLVYLAKKRAEVASGVGRQTDMIVFAPRQGVPGAHRPMNPAVYAELESAYAKLERAERRASKAALKKVNDFMGTLSPPPSTPGQATVTTEPTNPPPGTNPVA